MQKKQKKTAKILKELVYPFMIFLIITSLALLITAPAFAQDLETTLTTIGQPGEKEILPGFGTKGHAEASYEPGAAGITSAILFVVDMLKYFMGGIAVLVIIISGITLITAGKNIEEVSQKQKENIKYAIMGLIVIIVADTFVQQVFFGEEGEVLRSKADVQLAAERGAEQVRGIYSVMIMFAASLAILMIVYSGIRLVTSGGNEEVITKQKKQIMYAILGLMLLGIGEFAVKDIIFPEQGERLSDPEAAKALIMNITNFVSGFVATVAIAMYMYGGFLYVTSVGKEDQAGKAKKVFIAATIGLVIALGAFAIVNSVIKLQPPEIIPE